MATPDTARLRDELSRTVGPAPWYWQTFPAFQSAAGRRFVWSHQGESGPIGYLVSLGAEGQPEKPLLALNTYTRPFLVPEGRLGIWCPEGRSLRFICFDPDQLAGFDFAEVAGWFKSSSERLYSASAPVAEFEVPIQMPPGAHKVDVPPDFQTLDELIVPTTYPAESQDDPAMALFVVYFQAGLIEVLPQRWFTSAQYQVGRQWITRAARDPESHLIFGECFGAGNFLLQEDGTRLERWLEKN